MIKNPSFGTLLEIITQNVLKNNKECMTLACIIDPIGTMVVYDDIEEVIEIMVDPEVPKNKQLEYMMEGFLHASIYFYHGTFMFIPDHLGTPARDAKAALWWQALYTLGLQIPLPNKTVDISGKCFIQADKIKKSCKEFREVNKLFYSGVDKFVNICKDDAKIDRMVRPNNSSMYCIMTEPNPGMLNPNIMFGDKQDRPAIAKLPAAVFARVYHDYYSPTSGDTMDIFIYPDGTVANMTDYATMEIDLSIPDESLKNYIGDVLSENEDLLEVFDSMQHYGRLLYKLEILRIIWITSDEVIRLPYPMTPQQAVALEVLEETKICYIQHMEIEDLRNLYHNTMRAFNVEESSPITTGSFAFNTEQIFYPYSALSPDMKEQVSKVIDTKNRKERDNFLYDVTLNDKIFVVEKEE